MFCPIDGRLKMVTKEKPCGDGRYVRIKSPPFVQLRIALGLARKVIQERIKYGEKKNHYQMIEKPMYLLKKSLHSFQT